MLEIKAKSAYKPIQVKILGKVYTAKPMDRATVRKVGELEKRIKAGDIECSYEQLDLMLGKHKAFEKLEFRQINEIIEYIAILNYRAEKEDLKEDPKKESGPGGKN